MTFQAQTHKIKRTVAICFVFLGSFIPCFSQQYGWKDISASLPDLPCDTAIINGGQDTLFAHVRCLYFITEDEGWVILNNGLDSSYILHTADGADSWELRSLHHTAFNDIHMLDQTRGFAGGQDGGIIYKTTDGGYTWNFHWTLGTTLSEIEFPPAPADTGFVCGLNGSLMMITPTGGTMVNVNVNSDLHGLSFPVSISEGWLSGWNIVRHCINGTWYADQVHITGYHNDIHFINNQEGWTCGDRIMHTADGINWNTQLPQAQLAGDLFSIGFCNSDIGCAVGSVGQVFFTTNGGDTWEKLDLGTDEFLTDVQMLSPVCGYITGQGRTIFKYTEISGTEELGIMDPAVQVFPNPTTGRIEINISSPGRGYEAELYDISGQCLRKTVNTHEAVLDIADLAASIYFIRIKTGDSVSNHKVIKQ
ncbi:MAG: T9SS type A sorting domain-containing protein [Bacteroidales bacterium]